MHRVMEVYRGISLYVADHFLGRLTSVLPIKPKMNLPEPDIELALDSTGGTDYETRDLSLVSNRFDDNASALSFNGYGTTFSFTDENDTSGRSLTTWIKMEGDSERFHWETELPSISIIRARMAYLTLGDDGNESITTSLSNADLADNNGWFQLGITRKSNSLGISSSVAAGYYHSLFLKEDGSLWAMGYNGEGQLGNGEQNWNANSSPVQVVDSGVVQVAAGNEHSLFLKDDGSLWAMGYNWTGQLGNGNTENQTTPVQVVDSGVAQVAAGESHSLFLKDDGSLWAMGYNNYGQLGNGNIGQTSPVQVVDSGVAQVAAWTIPLTLPQGGWFALGHGSKWIRATRQWEYISADHAR